MSTRLVQAASKGEATKVDSLRSKLILVLTLAVAADYNVYSGSSAASHCGVISEKR